MHIKRYRSDGSYGLRRRRDFKIPVADVYDFFTSVLSGSYSSAIQKRVDFVGTKPRWSIKATPYQSPGSTEYTSEIYKIRLQADCEADMDSMIADFLQQQSLYRDVGETWITPQYHTQEGKDNYGDPDDEASPFNFGYDDTEGDEHDWYIFFRIDPANISEFVSDYRLVVTPQETLGAAYSPLYFILCNDNGEDGGSIGTQEEFTNTAEWTAATEQIYACSDAAAIAANFALFGTDVINFLILGNAYPPITTIAIDFQYKIGWPFYYISVKETQRTRHHTELEVEVQYHA